MTGTLTRALVQIVRQRSVANNVKLDGRLVVHSQSSLFNHAGDTLAYVPEPRPQLNGEDEWDIGLYHMPSGTPKLLTGHRGVITWIGFSPDDSLVISACWDKTFRVWDVETGEQRFRWETNRQNFAGAFKPDGTQFVGTDGRGVIRIWDLTTGDVMTEYTDGRLCGLHIDWSPDGRYIAVGGENTGQILLFDTGSLYDEAGNMVPVQQRVLDVTAVSDDDSIRRRISSHLGVSNIEWAGLGHRLVSCTLGDMALEIVDFVVNTKWRIMPFEPTDNQEADWERLPKSSFTDLPFRPGYSYLDASNEVALVCHDGVRFWKLQPPGHKAG